MTQLLFAESSLFECDSRIKQTTSPRGSDSAASLPIGKLRSTAQLGPFFCSAVWWSRLKERRARPGPDRRDSEVSAEVNLIVPAVGRVVPYPGEVFLALLGVVCFMDQTDGQQIYILSKEV